MEHEITVTGIGGQGVQLASQILTAAATLEGREVMSLGLYGGTMRGGNTDSTIVLADEPISTPPIVAHFSCALAMHDAFFEPIAKKLRPGAIVVVNSTVFKAKVDPDEFRVFEVPATRMADELGSSLMASLILLSAFSRLTAAVSLDSLIHGMRECLPSYRQHHSEANEGALRTGHALLPAGTLPLWSASGQGGMRG
ncbi:MAG: 2-oxoacid:acceptor oxidoreductase family protein [Myxococcota bacterium]|nr:2-oxoacid:acceptor oxidoreductase family protein [Myxococcota bacterium]